jgi:hypothetical protein
MKPPRPTFEEILATGKGIAGKYHSALTSAEAMRGAKADARDYADRAKLGRSDRQALVDQVVRSVEALKLPTRIHGDGQRGTPPRPPRRVQQSKQAASSPAPALTIESLWDFPKPPNREWVVEGFIPKGYVTLLAADGGTGKSFTAIKLAVDVARGRRFLGLQTHACRVLYLDVELDATEQKRRVWSVLEGQGITPQDPSLNGRLFYCSVDARLLGTEDGQKQIEAAIRENEIGLVIFDSLTIGMQGAAVESGDVVSFMNSFKRWGTVLAIDHVSSAGARGSAVDMRAFGSVFKRNIARSSWVLVRADGGGLLLRSNKNTFGPEADLLCYKVDFDGDAVRFESLGLHDDEMTGTLAHLSPTELTLQAVREVHRGNRERGINPPSVTPEEVISWREAHDQSMPKEGTIRNHFTALRQKGKIKLESGSATPCQPLPAQVHDFTPPLETVNRENSDSAPF